VDVPTPPLSQVRQYLGLTDDQVNAILQNNNDYNNYSFQQQGQILQAQSQIATETAKDTLDPMAIGVQYVTIENICRGLRAMAASSQQQNIAVLTDAQMVKLNALSDAMKLIPTISEAQSGNLLGSANATTFAFTTTSSFSSAFFGFSSVAGCIVNSVRTGVLTGVIGPVPAAPAP
jgi:hypothetical protein